MVVNRSPSLRYLIDSAKYPKDLRTTLDRVLGKHNEDPSRNLESAFSSSMITRPQYVSTSIVSNEVVHEEEVSHIVLVGVILFDSNSSSFNQEENIEHPYFSISLEVEDPD